MTYTRFQDVRGHSIKPRCSRFEGRDQLISAVFVGWRHILEFCIVLIGSVSSVKFSAIDVTALIKNSSKQFAKSLGCLISLWS